MSRTHKDSKGPGRTPRHISVVGVRSEPADVRKLARALIALAQAQVEADAEAATARKTPNGAAAVGPSDDNESESSS